MDLTKLAIGLVLIGTATLVQMRLSRRMTGWSWKSRLGVVGASVVGLVVYFAVSWTHVPMSTWWVVPFGFAGAALVDVTAYQVVTHGKAPRGSAA